MRRGATDLKSVGLFALIILLSALAGVEIQGLISPRERPVPVVVPPEPTPEVPPLPAAEPALVIVTDASGKRIESAEVEAVAAKLAVGTWIVHAIPKPGDTGWTRSVVVSEGPQPPPVVPPVVPPVTPPPVIPPVTPPPPEVKATAATFVYEKSDHAVPSPVLAALNRLNREKGVIATLFDHDQRDGTESIPDQYEVPLKAAKEVGLPALVVTAGSVVLKVVKNPTTEQQVMEAVP